MLKSKIIKEENSEAEDRRRRASPKLKETWKFEAILVGIANSKNDVGGGA